MKAYRCPVCGIKHSVLTTCAEAKLMDQEIRQGAVTKEWIDGFEDGYSGKPRRFNAEDGKFEYLHGYQDGKHFDAIIGKKEVSNMRKTIKPDPEAKIRAKLALYRHLMVISEEDDLITDAEMDMLGLLVNDPEVRERMGE